MAGKWRLTVVGAQRHPGRVWDVGSRQGATPCPESPCQPARQKWGLWGNRWHPNHTLLGPCLLCLEVLERLSCPLLHPREPISVLTCRGGQGQIHYKYSTIVLTTKYKCTTDSRQYTNTLQIQCNIHIQGEGPGAKGQTAPGVRSEDPLPSSF